MTFIRGKRVLLIVLGWAGVTLLLGGIRTLIDFDARMSSSFYFYMSGVQYALWALAFPLVSWLGKRLPIERGRRFSHGIALVSAGLVIAVAISLAHLAILFWTYYLHSDQGSYPTFASILLDRLFRYTRLNLFIAFFLIVMTQGWRVWQEFQEERARSAELKHQLAVSELETLRMQLNPHFLFNVLHTIASLIKDEPATARRMVTMLGDFLRQTLRPTISPGQSLGKELEFTDLYTAIEKLRIGDRLNLQYYIEQEAMSAEVPYLLLQPLFENAIRHGAARMAGPCEITFHAQREDKRLSIRLENDGPRQSDSDGEPGHGLGIKNTLARLSLLYDDNFTFQYTARPHGGVRIDMSLPYKKACEHEESYAGVTSADSYTHR